MATAKDCHVLISYYEKLYKERYLSAAVVNRNSAKWGFDAILKGMSPEDTKALLDYWFSVDSPQRHPITWFFYNYDKLITAKADEMEDATRRANLRHETAERVKKWRERRARG